MAPSRASWRRVSRSPPASSRARIGGSQPSLITAVGTQFIDRFAASLKDLAIALFGTNDKVALITGIVVVSLLLGAVLGRASVRRPLVGVVGFVAFGAVGLFSYLDAPLSEPAVGVVAAVVAAAAGIGTLFGLLHLLRLGQLGDDGGHDSIHVAR